MTKRLSPERLAQYRLLVGGTAMLEDLWEHIEAIEAELKEFAPREHDETRETIRLAAKRRHPLDGPDAQALEHALTQVEKELAEAKAEIARLKAASHSELENQLAEQARAARSKNYRGP